MEEDLLVGSVPFNEPAEEDIEVLKTQNPDTPIILPGPGYVLVWEVGPHLQMWIKP